MPREVVVCSPDDSTVRLFGRRRREAEAMVRDGEAIELDRWHIQLKRNVKPVGWSSRSAGCRMNGCAINRAIAQHWGGAGPKNRSHAPRTYSAMALPNNPQDQQ